MENSASLMKLTQFWRYLKHKACTLNNSKTGLHRLCTAGLNERWSKGHWADRLSMTAVYLLLKEQHLLPLCTTCHGMVWADLNSFYKSYSILKDIFSSFFFPLKNASSNNFTSTAFCYSLGYRKSSKGTEGIHFCPPSIHLSSEGNT